MGSGENTNPIVLVDPDMTYEVVAEREEEMRTPPGAVVVSMRTLEELPSCMGDEIVGVMVNEGVPVDVGVVLIVGELVGVSVPLLEGDDPKD